MKNSAVINTNDVGEPFYLQLEMQINPYKGKFVLLLRCITWLFAYCKGGNYNIYFQVWFGYFIC